MTTGVVTQGLSAASWMLKLKKKRKRKGAGIPNSLFPIYGEVNEAALQAWLQGHGQILLPAMPPRPGYTVASNCKLKCKQSKTKYLPPPLKLPAVRHLITTCSVSVQYQCGYNHRHDVKWEKPGTLSKTLTHTKSKVRQDNGVQNSGYLYVDTVGLREFCYFLGGV